MTVRNESAGGKPEGEGPYTKLIALGTVLLVILAYLAVAYSAHWPPFGSSHSASLSSGVPADYQGTWQGNIVDGNTSNQVSMSLGQGADGTQVGEFSNETLACQGAVYLEGGEGPIYLRMVTTSNTLNECVPFFYARASLTSGELNVALQDTSEVSPDEPASHVIPLAGTLERSS
jgi:hypothetical protein